MSICDEYRSMIPLVLDDELRGNELDDFGKHITGCTDCREALAHEQALSQLLHKDASSLSGSGSAPHACLWHSLF
jgi:hypothetical protein